MERSSDRHLFDQVIVFRAPDGAAVPARGRMLTLERVGDELDRCELEVEVAPEVYGRVDRGALFHLDPARRGPGAGPSFGRAGDVRITLRLARRQLLEVGAFADSARAAAELLVQLGESAPDHPLIDTEGWYALAVRQREEVPPDVADGELWSGYATTWAEVDEEGEGSPAPGALLAAMMRVLDEGEWPYQRQGEEPLLHVLYEGTNGEWPVAFMAREEYGQCLVLSQLGQAVPPARRDEAARWVALANYGLAVGSFDLDLGTGELRFRTGLALADEPLPPALFGEMVEINVDTMDRHLPAIAALVDEGASAAEAQRLVS